MNLQGVSGILDTEFHQDQVENRLQVAQDTRQLSRRRGSIPFVHPL
jgi:hypothetical protein